MIKDIRYIIKKVIIGFLIGVLLFLFRSSYSYALTLNPYYMHIITENNEFLPAGGRIIDESLPGVPFYITKPKGTTGNTNPYYTTSFVLSFTGLPNDGQEYTLHGTGYHNAQSSGIPVYYIFGTNTETNRNNIQSLIENAGSPISACKITLASPPYSGYTYFEYQPNGNLGTLYANTVNSGNNSSTYSFECGGVGGYQYYILIATYAKNYTQFGISARLSYASNKTAEALLEIKEEQEKTTQAIKDMTDTIKSEDAPSDNQYSGLSENNANNGVINQLITMPITLAQSYLNGFNSSCTPFRLGTLYGEELILPCINPQNYLGAMWSVIDVIISGIFIFVFGKKLVKIFNDVTNLKENQVNEVFD